MLNQISIYMENKRGAAKTLFDLLAKGDINVLSLVSSNSGEFGTMRIIVSDTEKAMSELSAHGYLCKVDDVLAAEIEDTPGSLEVFLGIIENVNINIDYLYVAFMRDSRKPAIVAHCDDVDIVEGILRKKGYTTY